MLRTVSLALIGASMIGGAAMAQVVALPAQPPTSPSNPIQDGAYVNAGQTQSGNLAVTADGGRQAPVQAQVSPDRTPATSGANVYARLPKDTNGLPQGADVRLSVTDKNGQQTPYQGVQLGKQ